MGESTSKDKEPTLTPDQKAQQASVQLAVDQGPTAYTDAMRANLGFAPAGATPDTPKTTGMAALTSQPYWSSPVEYHPDPLGLILGLYTPPASPSPDTTTPATGGNGGSGKAGSSFMSLLTKALGGGGRLGTGAVTGNGQQVTVRR